MEPERYMYYCPKCGDVWFSDGDKCFVCKHEMIESPHEYQLSWEEWHVTGANCKDHAPVWEEREQRLYDEVISKSPIFDLNLYNRRDEIKEERHRRFQEDMAKGQAIMEGTDKGNPYGVRCPYCNATNVRRISGLARAGLFALFGIFALGKSGKQWHCTHCGSDF